jgi:hypothetical protein
MVKKSYASKHPAMASHQPRTPVVRRSPPANSLTQEQLHSQPGWSMLNSEHQRFLAMYCWWRDALKALKLMGKPESWLEVERKRIPGFQHLCEMVMDAPMLLADQMVEQMLPYSVQRLRQLITQDDDKRLQLNAIKHLHYLAGMISNAESDNKFVNQFMNVNIKMFPTDSKEEPLVLDANNSAR